MGRIRDISEWEKKSARKGKRLLSNATAYAPERLKLLKTDDTVSACQFLPLVGQLLRSMRHVTLHS